jgi:hypothetical protein
VRLNLMLGDRISNLEIASHPSQVRGSIDRSVSWANGDPDAPPDAQNDAPADGLTSLRDVGSFDRDMDRDTDPYNGGGDGYSPRAARMLLALAADEGSPQQQNASFYSTLPNLTQLSRGASLTERFDEVGRERSKV